MMVQNGCPWWKKMASQQAATNWILTELKICSSTMNLEKGKEIHALAMEIANDSCIYVANSLVHMYAKCGSMDEASEMFESIKNPSVVSCNALILGYAENGKAGIGLDLFSWMRSQGCTPNSFTFVAALKACTCLALTREKGECLEKGKQIHSEIGHFSNIYVQNTLIDMYAKCGSMAEARGLFDSMEHPDKVSWNALICGYVESGDAIIALHLFARISQGRVADRITIVAALKACASLGEFDGSGKCLKWGRKIHSKISCHSDNFVQSALIGMYAKCGSMVDARKVFEDIQHPDLVSWTTLIMGYADEGEGIIALDLFSRMKSQGCAPDSIIFVAVIKSCTSLAQDRSGRAECLKRGRQLHSEIGCNLNIYVQHTLMDMYAKCGCMVEAQRLFNGMKHRNVVSWNVLILGYVENKECLTALDLFARMKSEGYAPDCITFVATLKAFSLLGDLESGRKLHAEIKSETEFDVILVTCLVEFYARCGSNQEAQSVFDSNPETRDLLTWNALLAGYSHSGESKTVFELFEKMQDVGLKPDGITLLCILGCCSYSGLPEKAKECFDAMPTKYGLTPSVEHYTCMIDILGCSNKLDDAMALLRSMPYTPDDVTWMTVLDACRKWKNVEIARLAFQSLISLDSKNAAAYVLMAEVYGNRGMWDERDKILERHQILKMANESRVECPK